MLNKKTKENLVDGVLMFFIFLGMIGSMLFTANLIVFPSREIDGWHLATGLMIMVAFLIVAFALINLKVEEEKENV